jgi:hypothetical protein
MVVDGQGSYGIVLSSPRISLADENYEDIKDLEQVSKLLYYIQDNKYYPEIKEQIINSYDNALKLIEENSEIFNKDNFMLPIKGGYIDKFKFVSEFNDKELGYGFDWLSKSKKYYDIIQQLISHTDEVFQIIYEKGTKINFDFETFILKMNNICDTLVLCNKNGFYFDDLKYANLIVHNDKIKIIDFDEPINLNVLIDECEKKIEEAKFHDIMYFPYDTLSLILLYEFIGKINKIGCLNNGNYNKILEYNTHEFNENVEYKLILFDNLVLLWDKYLKIYTVDVEVYDLKLFDTEEFEKKEFNLKKHFEMNNDIKLLTNSKKTISVDIKMFINTIKIIFNSYLIQKKNVNHNNNNIKQIINKFVILKKKFIKLTKKTHTDIISYLLTNTNIYSFGFIFLDWLKINIKKILPNELNTILEKIIKIIINCCLNFIIIDNSVYLLNRNYLNIEKIIKNF